MLFPSLVLKDTKDILKKNFFSDYSYGRYKI